MGRLNNAKVYCKFINVRSLETDNFPMIYTVEQNAIPDLIRELHQTLTAKDSLYAKTTAKLLHVYARHQSSRVDSASALSSPQLDNRLALKKISLPVGQADFCRAFHDLAGKPLTRGEQSAKKFNKNQEISI